MREMESALRELESATAAVAVVPVEDFAEGQAAMDRRRWAIADVAALSAGAIPELEREDVLRRLQRAYEAGEKAERRLASIRNTAAVEWGQWSRIYRALGAAVSPRVDCKA